MQLLDNYLALQKEIYEYFGFVEAWQTFPIEDSRDEYWYLDERIGCVHSANTEEELINEVGNYYVSEFYRVSDECKAVYTTDEYSMILVDTLCDGNRSMCIFDNSKRRQELAKRD